MIAVALVACVASLVGLVNQFGRDDLPIVVADPRIHDLAHLGQIFSQPYWPPPASPDLYRPFASLLLALQYVIGGGSPVVFRLVSILLYALASVAVLRLAQRWLTPTIALGAALLFAAHPVHVEAVAQAVNQGELIVAAIAGIMTVKLLDGRRHGLPTKSWIGLGALYFVATLTKETAFVIPLLLLAADVLAPADRVAPRAKGWWLGYVLLLAPGVLAFALRASVVGSGSGSFVADALIDRPIGVRALTMLGVVPEWARLLVWPAHLRTDYSPGEFVAATSFGAAQAIGLVIILIVAILVWLTRRRAPAIAFGLLWCAIAIAPVSNVLLPTGVLIAERTLFLPSVGFLIAIAGVAELALSTVRSQATIATRAVAAAAAVLIVAGIGRSMVRQRDWYDTSSLRAAALKDSPRSWRTLSANGATLFDEGRPAEGTAAYREAMQWAPSRWMLRNELADRLRRAGNDSAALTELRASLVEQPGQREGSVKFISTLLAVGNYQEARNVADSIIVVAGAPRIIVALRKVADSAMVLRAPVGSVRVGIR